MTLLVFYPGSRPKRLGGQKPRPCNRACCPALLKAHPATVKCSPAKRRGKDRQKPALTFSFPVWFRLPPPPLLRQRLARDRERRSRLCRVTLFFLYDVFQTREKPLGSPFKAMMNDFDPARFKRRVLDRAPS